MKNKVVEAKMTSIKTSRSEYQADEERKAQAWGSTATAHQIWKTKTPPKTGIRPETAKTKSNPWGVGEGGAEMESRCTTAA